uniref:BCL10 immune signaling adaptor n=1 Tax=Homo sapiens TaxID=9606 RepID=A0A3B3ISX2_HUMAN
MEPTAPSLTEEDLTEVKKDVSNAAVPRAGGGGLQPSGRRKRKPGVRGQGGSSRSEERKVLAQEDCGEPCIRGTLVAVILQ